MEKIFRETKSPLNDENLEKLILQLLEAGGASPFYDAINNLDEQDGIIQNREMLEFAGDLRNISEGCGREYILNMNDSWLMLCDIELLNNKEYFSSYKFDESSHYRIYLNLPEDKRVAFVKRYMVACREQGVPLQFKFSLCDGRYDQFMALCPVEKEEWFKKTVEIVELITSDMDLGKLPPLVGEYKNGIGIVEVEGTRSYTIETIKLMLAAISINMVENTDKLMGLTDDKELLDDLDFFLEDEKHVARIRSGKEKPTALYGTMRAGDLYKREFGLFARLLKENPDIMKNVIKDFRWVAKVYGRASNIIFSQKTEDKIMKPRQGLVKSNNIGFSDGEDR